LTRPFVPPAVLTAAHERSAARAAHDWAAADRLRGEIEAAGWRVIDAGTDFRLEPAHAPDVLEAGRPRYGHSEGVPSRLDAAPEGLATVIMVASDPDDIKGVGRAVRGLGAALPAGTSLVVVADGLDAAATGDLEATLDGAAPDERGGPGAVEVVGTSVRLGEAAALNIGFRRAAGPILVVLDPSIEPTGDIVTPLAIALADPGVGIAGASGLVSEDLRRFAESDRGDAAAIQGFVMAFRREDAAVRGPLDERFTSARNLDIWWSLVLRDEGPDRPPRRAVVVPGLPLVRHEEGPSGSTPGPDRDRLSKRNFYRVLDRFGFRQDLALPGR